MKTAYNCLILFVLVLIVLACANSKEKEEKSRSKTSETNLLFGFIEKSGDIINSEQAPFLVTAEEVYNNNGRYFIIDTRDSSDYYAGHIDGAVNVGVKELISFLDKSVSSESYEKIVITCYSGQTASFYTTLLRLIGYSKVYSLKFGMSGWSRKISPNKITSNISDKYARSIETKANTCQKTYDLPKLNTGETGGYAIMCSRVKAISNEGFGKANIKIDTVMKNPSNYFIINYWPSEQYNKGHLPGAVQFEPRQSFLKDKMMKYLPTNQTIVVYCLSGQSSASVVAYLRVLGYNALSLSFGANGFMHNFTQGFNDKAFNPSRDIADYPLITGKTPNLETPSKQGTMQEPKEETVPVTVPVKKKQKTGGGGC